MTYRRRSNWKRERRDPESQPDCQITVAIERETGRAYLISDGISEAWVPRSLVKSYDPATLTMTLPEWLAKEKGFI